MSLLSMHRTLPRPQATHCTALAIFSLGVGVWLACFVLSRAHMMHVSYNTIVQQRDDESWLLQQCKQDEFYHNMKQHSALCDELAVRGKNVAAFDALQHVVDNTYLCGYTPCHEMLDSVSAWMLGRGLVLTLFLVVLVLTMLSLLLPLWRRNMNLLADKRMQEIYNTPYGESHYTYTHPMMVLGDS